MSRVDAVPQSIEDYLIHDQLKIQMVADGSYRAWSTVRGQFSEERVSFMPRDGSDAWQAVFILDSVNGDTVSRGRPVAEDATVSYPITLPPTPYPLPPNIIELYENRTDGIEQKFIIESSQFTVHSPKFELVGHFETNLVPHRVSGRGIVFTDGNGVEQLVYGEATAIDAKGKTTSVEMTIDNFRNLKLEIRNLQGFTFPLVIDPLITTPNPTLDPTNQTSANFGISALTAGDVNGDTYSDVIVTAYTFDAEAVDEGRAYIYHGSPTGLSSTPAITLDPTDQTQALFGISAGAAGDVNGDGFGDVIVGAHFWSDPGPDGLIGTNDPGEIAGEGRAFIFHGGPSGLSATPALALDSTNQINAAFGGVVGTAGDVNGDGFSDVFVGATLYDADFTNEGRTYIFHGSPTGLSSTPALTLDPANQANASFAVTSTAGDVNGDGFSDVIARASRFDAEAVDEGRVYIYHGSAAGLSSTPAITIDPTNQTDAQFGFGNSGNGAATLAGDVNGDGYADVVVGAPFFDGEAANEGRVYIYRGSATGIDPATELTLDPTNQAGAEFGFSAFTAGDANGDGYSDIVIGADRFDADATDEGRMYLYQGSSTGINSATTTTLDPTNQVDARFGAVVGTAGDVDGDGFSDVIAGAFNFDAEAPDEGRVYLFRGSPDGLATATGWFVDSSNQANASFGVSVASASDVNGDGFEDIIVGAPFFDAAATDEGRAYVFHGGATGPSLTPNTTLDPADDQTSEQFGFSVSGAGDVNGDGYGDVAVSAVRFDATATDEGRVYLYHGGAAGLSTTPALTMNPTGLASARFGQTIGAGDVNGDGFSDIIVGAPFGAGETAGEGRAYLFHGSAAGLSAAPTTTLDPANQASATFGHSVAFAGDVNGDGFSDIIVTAPLFNAEFTDEGRVYVFHGSATGASGTPAWTADPTDQTSAQLGGGNVFNGGRMVASAGDVNGDGFADVVIGAPLWGDGTTGVTDEGRAYIYYGGAAGLQATPALTLDPTDQANAQFGFSVAPADDVNGDSFSDVIASAFFFDAESTDEGRVYVYHGASVGLSATPALSLDHTNEGGAFLGRSLGAGDTNGDGYSDVIMSADGMDTTEANEGRVYLFFGGGSQGLSLRPEQRRTDSSVPIQILAASDSNTSAQIRMLARTPAGRGRVRLEVEAERDATAFDGAGTVLSVVTDTGVAGASISQLVSGLVPNGTPYHWRARLRYNQSPLTYFGGQVSHWISLQGSTRETDFRTANAQPTVANLIQRPTGDPNPLALGGRSTDTRLTFEATGTDDGATYTLEVEVKPIESAFDGTGLLTSATTNAGQQARIETILNTGSYHWRARARDSRNLAGPFTTFGTNPETDPDFRIAISGAAPPGTPLVSPAIRVPTALDAIPTSSTTIRYTFQDNAPDETGFTIHDLGERVLTTSNEINLAFLHETGLLPNTTYCDRHVHARKGGEMSAASADYPCRTTLAEVPPAPTVTTADTQATVMVSAGGNPTVTTYAVAFDDQYLEADGTLGATPFYQTLEAWGGTNGVVVRLTPGAYAVTVTAQNQAGVPTEPSRAVAIAVGPPALSISKAVSVNLPATATVASTWASFLPLATQANPFLTLALIATALLTATGARRLDRHHKVPSTQNPVPRRLSFRYLLRPPAPAYQAIMGCGPEGCAGPHYRRHAKLHRAAQLSLWSMLILGALKLGLATSLALFTVQAGYANGQEAANQDGTPVRAGDTLTYELTAQNTGGPTTSSFLIQDPIPQWTSFIPGTLIVRGSPQTELPDSDDAEVVRDIVRVRLDAIPAEGMATIRFAVLVNPDARDAVMNTALLSGSDLALPLRSNTTSNSILVAREEITPLSVLTPEVPLASPPASPPPPEALLPEPTPREPAPMTAPVPTPERTSLSQPFTQPPPPAPALSPLPAPTLPPALQEQALLTMGVLQSCSDGMDNDSDGIIDYPREPGCASPQDQDETDPVGVIEPLAKTWAGLRRVAPTTVASVEKIAEATVNHPAIEQATRDYLVPALAVAAGVNVGVASASGNLFPLLSLLFTRPIALIMRRRKGLVGTVYNTGTKLPVDLAEVRLIDQAAGRLVHRRVTDGSGHYAFTAPHTGTFRLEVHKKDRRFSSVLLQGLTRDGSYQDLYFGEPFTAERGTLIAKTIPIDPAVTPMPRERLKFKIDISNSEFTFAAFSLIAAGLATITVPRTVVITLLVIHLALYLVIRRIVKLKLHDEGRITSPHGKPFGGVLVSLFDGARGTLLAQTVTDLGGHYAFRVGPNRYRIRAERPDLAPIEREIDLLSITHARLLSEDIQMIK